MKLKEQLDKAIKPLTFAIWCETCQDWKTEFRLDSSGPWVLCNDCDEGLVKVIK